MATQIDAIKPSDLERANARLKMLEFYPSDPEAQAAVLELLAKMCPHRTALEWLVDTMTNRVGRWHGPKELRGLLCTRWPPADGVEVWCSLPGFTPEDSEAQYLANHEQMKQLEQAPIQPIRRLLN